MLYLLKRNTFIANKFVLWLIVWHLYAFIQIGVIGNQNYSGIQINIFGQQFKQPNYSGLQMTILR